MRSGNSASWGKNRVFTGYRKGGHETKRVTRKLQKEHWAWPIEEVGSSPRKGFHSYVICAWSSNFITSVRSIVLFHFNFLL